MEAIKLKARVRPDGTIVWPDPPHGLPAGDAEIILLYPSSQAEDFATAKPESSEDAKPATCWPRLKGGRWKGGTLRREDLYGDMGR